MSNQSVREQLIKEIKLQLGDPIIDVELEYDHYDYAITKAFDRYRQRSSNAVEESYTFLEAQPEQSVYILPKEIIEVRTLYRRGAGISAGGTGSQIDPFSLSITNNYVIKPGGGGGGLALYELFMEYSELVGQMFGLFMNYSFDAGTRRLTLMRRIVAPESFLMWVYNYKPDEVLLNDTYARTWLRSWAIAECKMMLGDIRGKYQSTAGPQGGTSLNGAELKSDANSEFERLENEVKGGHEQNMGYSFVIG